MIGIYAYKNKINGKYYVGQSVNIVQRDREHRCRAFNSKSSEYNSLIHRAFRKYGIKNFKLKNIKNDDIILM